VVVNLALKIAGALALSDTGFSSEGRGPAAAVWPALVLAGAVFGVGVWDWARRLAHTTMAVAIAFIITDCTKRRGDSVWQESKNGHHVYRSPHASFVPQGDHGIHPCRSARGNHDRDESCDREKQCGSRERQRVVGSDRKQQAAHESRKR